VDLPEEDERKEILAIMAARYGVDMPESLASRIEGYTGSEIEQIAKEAAFDGLEAALGNVVPLSKTGREGIEALRKWAAGRTRPASRKTAKKKQGRKVSI